VTRSCCSIMTDGRLVIARSLSGRQLNRLRRSRHVLPQCSDSVAMGAIADTADAPSKRRFRPISEVGLATLCDAQRLASDVIRCRPAPGSCCRGYEMITATVRYKLPPHIDYVACREHFHKID